MYELDKDIQHFLRENGRLTNSEYIEWVIRIHHEMTVIHAFRDGSNE